MNGAYSESAVQRLLAEDKRVAEQGIRVVAHGDVLQLCGEVESPERCAMIEQIINEAFPGIALRSDIAVTKVRESTEAEEL